jgi:hypothetical protein
VLFIVTVRPEAACRYYGPQLTAAGDWWNVQGELLVIFAAHGPRDNTAGKRSVLVMPLDDLLAVDEV